MLQPGDKLTNVVVLALLLLVSGSKVAARRVPASGSGVAADVAVIEFGSPVLLSLSGSLSMV